MVPTTDTYYRTLNGLIRNTSTSAWVSNTSVTFPFWPSSESAQLGPQLASPYEAWKSNTIVLEPRFKCEEMTLESSEMTLKRYSEVYTTQRYGPLNGTQPMVTFVLTSGTGCRYELSIHPLVDMASSGGVTWSDASTFYRTTKENIHVGGRVYPGNVTSTHIYARVNASEQCKGRDIILMSTPWTVPLSFTERMPFMPANQTYERSSGFRMRGLLCDSQYFMSKQNKGLAMVGTRSKAPDATFNSDATLEKIPESLINLDQFQTESMQDTWRSYFDEKSLQPLFHLYPEFSGMAPLLAALSNYNVSSMIEDPNIALTAALIKGRVFTETLKESFSNARAMDTGVIQGEATVVESRVVVLTEIGFTLAAVFFASSILLMLIFWSSRLAHRPLHLRSDPASTVGLCLLLDQSSSGLSTLRNMHQASRVDLYTALQGEKYSTSNNVLSRGDNDNGLLLTLVLVAVLILNAFSARSQLSQLAFIYEADVSKLKLSFSTFAPISIAPTVISIIVGLWWDQLDSTFRILYPFISMSRGPTPICDGAGLTYRSKSWIGAAIKAGRKRHWVLLMISVGSVLAQVLTVSMSALFEREVRNVLQRTAIPRDLEMRQVPIITEAKFNKDGGNPLLDVLDTLYLDASKNWLYGAGIQHSYNGSQLPWTSEGWSFLPVDLSSISNHSKSQSSSNGDNRRTAEFPINVTLNVPAIRARLSCRVIDEIGNMSSWIQPVNITKDPGIYKPSEITMINGTGKMMSYQLMQTMFAGTDSHTSVLPKSKEATCCGNGTINNPQRAIMGYWSPVLPAKAFQGRNYYPYEALTWPISLTTKWIVGNPFLLTTNGLTSKNLFFEEVPQIQAARCEPIIETADATVTVNKDTGNVLSHTIEGDPTQANGAWADVFTMHEPSNKTSYNITSLETMNITASFGVLFLDSLLGSADRSTSTNENLNENSFNIRDQNNGIAMDLMTYSMYTLADKNPDALLNFTTLAAYADRTFQTFFQHFVNSGLSLSKGGLAYQPINDDSMNSIGRSIDENGTAIAEKRFPVLNSDRTIIASASYRIRVLHMNNVATYLSTAILIWLILTTLIVICLQRKYTKFMNRDVQLIADMLVLVAGSDNFLELVAEKGVDLKKNKDIKTMLGWFRDRDGQVRWGVEVVGGRNAVEWVDAPKQGFHIPGKSSKNVLAWRR
ncbi:hypothetical protein CC86DRAFT_354293 [Ophiobolus disseminans]|uniref:Uncharacterized protein n=1 Tax=Ophiobolus disseminans TaxID=1469910 RepID=A0A6A6ZTE9_9PLEO|nr:hypothetical protein CC86DRAFT_354293 [Ophiobolus disseminans]